jgi:hypothetical protein
MLTAVRTLVVSLLVTATALADVATSPLDILVAYRKEVATQLDWVQHRVKADDVLKEVRAGDCSHALGRMDDCKAPAARATLEHTIEHLIAERHHVQYTKEISGVPISLEARLQSRVTKLDDHIGKLKAGKSDGVYCDVQHTKLDLVDGCYDLTTPAK